MTIENWLEKLVNNIDKKPIINRIDSHYKEYNFYESEYFIDIWCDSFLIIQITLPYDNIIIHFNYFFNKSYSTEFSVYPNYNNVPEEILNKYVLDEFGDIYRGFLSKSDFDDMFESKSFLGLCKKLQRFFENLIFQ